MKPVSVLLLLACFLSGQQTPPPATPIELPNSLDALPEPEAAEVFYALRNGKLIPLEHQTSTHHFSAAGFMVMSTKSVNRFPGPRSPVRFHAEERLEIVFRTGLKIAEFDPNTRYCVRKLDTTKKNREYTFSKGVVTPAGGKSDMNPLASVVPVEFSRHGEHSVKMSVGPLQPGEYAAGTLYGLVAYCFGVD